VRAAVAGVLGIVTIFGTLAYLLLEPGSSGDSALLVALAVLVGIVGVVGALVKVASSDGDGGGVAPAPWGDDGALVGRAPERSPAEYDLSGERLAEVVESAGENAREEGTVGAGVDDVRPHLRDVLLDVLVQGGTDRATAETALERGTWTDDQTAAAVLDGDVAHPGWSLVERSEAWLFPEQVLRREVQQAMQAIAAVAERELPTVPGQHAPRTVPVLQPTLEDLQRGADGQLQRAVEPLRARSGAGVDGARPRPATDGSVELADDGTPDTDTGSAKGQRDDEPASGRDARGDAGDDDSPSGLGLAGVQIGARTDDQTDEEVTRG
jgi:hypothetical protein